MKRLQACVVLSLALVACGCASSTGDDDDDPNDVSTDDASALTAGWTVLGNGVAYKSTGAGDGAFIGYAGYSVPLDRSAIWVDALFEARLKMNNVGHLYAVRGPSDAGY